jgi:hypothetical protein
MSGAPIIFENADIDKIVIKLIAIIAGQGF